MAKTSGSSMCFFRRGLKTATSYHSSTSCRFAIFEQIKCRCRVRTPSTQKKTTHITRKCETQSCFIYSSMLVLRPETTQQTIVELLPLLPFVVWHKVNVPHLYCSAKTMDLIGANWTKHQWAPSCGLKWPIHLCRLLRVFVKRQLEKCGKRSGQTRPLL